MDRIDGSIRLFGCEPGRRIADDGEKAVATTVPGIFEDMKLARRLSSGQSPGGLEWTADVVQAVD